MDHCAFIGLEDISDGLPSYREEVVPVAMEEPLKTAYEELEEEITACLKEHRGNSSVASTMLNALLAWPDHPYGFGTLYGSEFDPETKCRESFVIAETPGNVTLVNCCVPLTSKPEHEEVLALLLGRASHRLDRRPGDRYSHGREAPVLRVRLDVVAVVDEHAPGPQRLDVVVIAVLVEGHEDVGLVSGRKDVAGAHVHLKDGRRSEEHTSELQSL